MTRLLAALLLSSACGMPPADDDDVAVVDAGAEDTGVHSDSGVAICRAIEPEVVHFTTDDGVTLEADFWTRGAHNGAAAILLHMTPSGGNDRTNFSNSFADKLVMRGVSVLNVNRRGVGTDDDALKESAYLGPDGTLDAKAAYDFLRGHPCEFNPLRIGLIGASNGTTTALDFTIFADGAADLEVPKALVFLTGGSYTENQFAIDDHRPLLDGVSILFLYSDAEATWSVRFRDQNPSPMWSFLNFPLGHGTQILDLQPNAADFVTTWIAERL